MPGDPEIAHLAGIAERFLEGWVSHNPKKLNGEAFVREQMRLSALSPPNVVWTPDDGRLPFFGVNHAYDDDKGARLIASACTGDVSADVVLSSIAAHYVRNQCVMPPRLRDYMSRKLDAVMATGEPWPKPRRKGRPRNGNARRDFAITIIVTALSNRGLPIESARAQHSASSIVGDALTNVGITLDDRSIVRIWKANREHADWYDGGGLFA